MKSATIFWRLKRPDAKQCSRNSSRWGGVGLNYLPHASILPPSNSTPPQLMMYANTVLSGRFSLQKIMANFIFQHVNRQVYYDYFEQRILYESEIKA